MAGELIDAIQSGDEERARSLLRERPELASDRDESGASALLLSLYNGLGVTDAIRETLRELDVFEAAAVGDVERISELLDDDPERARAWTQDGFTALHYAAFFDGPVAAGVLLDHGADPNVQAKHPQLKVFPIHSAAASQQLETVRLLLEHGADPNVRADDGFTALHTAAFHGDRALADLLLTSGADPALATDEGRTPADTAEEKGHDEVAVLLRARG